MEAVSQAKEFDSMIYVCCIIYFFLVQHIMSRSVFIIWAVINGPRLSTMKLCVLGEMDHRGMWSSCSRGESAVIVRAFVFSVLVKGFGFTCVDDNENSAVTSFTPPIHDEFLCWDPFCLRQTRGHVAFVVTRSVNAPEIITADLKPLEGFSII